jgi:hypothetical protein
VAERRLEKATGRGGRADALMICDVENRFAAIAEIKNTDWEAMERRGTVRRNVTRHARQVWSYLDGFVEAEMPHGTERIALGRVERYAALVYPHVPAPALRAALDDAFGKYGISIVWLDEPPPRDSEVFSAWAERFATPPGRDTPDARS